MTVKLRYACPACGTWTREACGWKRPGASTRYTDHSCGHCGGITGTIVPTMHTAVAWRRHNVDADGLPQGYPFGTRPEGEVPEVRKAEREPTTYHGVPVPLQGPYQQLDYASWCRGVDDAIKALESRTYDRGARAGWDAAEKYYKIEEGEGS